MSKTGCEGEPELEENSKEWISYSEDGWYLVRDVDKRTFLLHGRSWMDVTFGECSECGAAAPKHLFALKVLTDNRDVLRFGIAKL